MSHFFHSVINNGFSLFGFCFHSGDEDKTRQPCSHSKRPSPKKLFFGYHCTSAHCGPYLKHSCKKNNYYVILQTREATNMNVKVEQNLPRMSKELWWLETIIHGSWGSRISPFLSSHLTPIRWVIQRQKYEAILIQTTLNKKLLSNIAKIKILECKLICLKDCCNIQPNFDTKG